MIKLSIRKLLRITSVAAVLVSAMLTSNLANAASVKVAFVGDQGVGQDAQAVLSLIKNEGTDLLLIQGDLGYKDGTASTWEANLSNALGADFPVLTVVGNHENFEWPIYQSFIKSRVERASGLSCTGEAGVKALCRYENIEIVQVSPGINEVEGVKASDNYAQFITDSFAESTASWRICSWHKNQSKMQTGSKSNATGWDVYDACLNVGAMVALAHEHAYSRTHLLSDFRNQKIVHKNSEMTLESGKSFAFVSGLGGREVREQSQGGDWWASIYTGSQGATHGALFCTFGDTTADCYFKAIDGAVPDQFSLRMGTGITQAQVNAAQPPPLAAPEVQTLAEAQPEVDLSADNGLAEVQPESDATAANGIADAEPEADVSTSNSIAEAPPESDISASNAGGGSVQPFDTLETTLVDSTTPEAQVQAVPGLDGNLSSTESDQIAALPLEADSDSGAIKTGSGRFSVVFLLVMLSLCVIRRFSKVV